MERSSGKNRPSLILHLNHRRNPSFDAAAYTGGHWGALWRAVLKNNRRVAVRALLNPHNPSTNAHQPPISKKGVATHIQAYPQPAYGHYVPEEFGQGRATASVPQFTRGHFGTLVGPLQDEQPCGLALILLCKARVRQASRVVSKTLLTSASFLDVVEIFPPIALWMMYVSV